MDDLIINDDLEFENGDLKIADSDIQNLYAIMKARKGQFYQHPLLGVGIDDYQNASIDKRIIRREIINEIKKDNYRIDSLTIDITADDVEVGIIATKLK